MATAKERGIPSLASALLRPSTTPTQPEQVEADPVEDQAEAEIEQGRGAVPSEPKPRSRTRRATTGGETRGRKLSIPDSVFDRLQLTAIQRRKTISAVAAEILDRNLPRLRIERES
jgi:hypothetical protein